MKAIRLMLLFAIILFTFDNITNAQTAENFYYPTLPQVEFKDAKIKLKNLLETIPVRDKSIDYGSMLKDVSVFDDRIEMTYKTNKSKVPITIYFSEILNDNIVVLRLYDLWPEGYNRLEFKSFYFIGNVGNRNYVDVKGLADYLFYFQYRLNGLRYDSLLNVFKPIAKKYLALNPKPTISEDQRKYIVQANGFNEQKMYDKAISLYKKAIEKDETAYPAAYSNLALLSAQAYKFDAAIYYMKKYLMLVPEAEDARGAQDKIYEWEARIAQ
jgi:tetratricopeptide (TPR) repeat protein